VRPDRPRPVQLSVLDRLVDDGSAPGDEFDPERSFERMKIALRRDLEWLLNTRRTMLLPPEGTEELEESVYTFGLPDLTSMSKDDPETRQRLLRLVQEAVERFEPRLGDVRVALMRAPSVEQRELHFLIEGVLRRDPSPEQVAFDTVLRIVTGEIDVMG
jgi:type VI secretion system protein ImpF